MRSPVALRTHRLATLAMLLAAAALLSPGAAVAAPTVIRVADSAPVSLLHGEATAPRPGSTSRPTARADQRRRRRRQLRRRWRAIQHRFAHLIAAGTASRRHTVGGVPPRASPARGAWTRGPPSCGPPTNLLQIDLHDRADRHTPAVIGPNGSDRARCVAERPTGRVPHRAAQQTLRSGAGTARGAHRDTAGRTVHPHGCRCRSRRTTR